MSNTLTVRPALKNGLSNDPSSAPTPVLGHSVCIPQFTRVHNCDAQVGRWWGNAASSPSIAFHFVWEYRQSGRRCALEMREERKLVFSQLWTLVNCGIDGL
uniref:uncharacterized protein LOC117602855 n=1 Tax=Osmia lignaria TaxID=473952 RepID=UPI001478F9F0|nr:uncharacterized protein LOC117602855 [Osmia lignaria]